MLCKMSYTKDSEACKNQEGLFLELIWNLNASLQYS